MPELPEILVLRDQLQKYLVGAQLISIKSTKPSDLIKKINNAVEEIKIGPVLSRGKYLFIKLGKLFIRSHLMLTGRWEIGPGEGDFIINFSTPRGTRELRFRDKMKLGHTELINSDEYKKTLSKLGPQADEITKMELAKLLSESSTPIAVFLMEQSKISGIGNYLRAEILYNARINPFRKCNTLTGGEISALYKAIKFTISDVLKYHASSKYADLREKKGDYQFKVYGKKTDPQGKIISQKTIQGRKIYWSPAKQPP